MIWVLIVLYAGDGAFLQFKNFKSLDACLKVGNGISELNEQYTFPRGYAHWKCEAVKGERL